MRNEESSDTYTKLLVGWLLLEGGGESNAAGPENSTFWQRAKVLGLLLLVAGLLGWLLPSMTLWAFVRWAGAL